MKLEIYNLGLDANGLLLIREAKVDTKWRVDEALDLAVLH